MTRQTALPKSSAKCRRGACAAFYRNGSGNIALVFGLVAGVLALAGGGAMDYAMLLSVRQDMQSAADAAAIAAARELYVMKGTDTHVRAVAKSMVATSLAADDAIGSFVTDATIDRDRNTVTASIVSKPKVYFSALTGLHDSTVTVNATAQILGSGRICVLALEDSKEQAISLEKSARVTARKCSVFSNSSHKYGIKAHNTSRLTAEMTCSAGGVHGSQSNFAPQPETDCPVLADPLADRPAPPFSGCTKTKLTLDSGITFLSPGVYCDGLKITEAADVRLKPGVYVIKDGPLIVDKSAKFTGEYVGFYFTGDKATFKFTKDSVIDIGAPKTGPLAGLLFFGDRTNKPGKKYRIESNNARNLLGTIYLPNGDLEIEADNPVADKSAFTVLVSLGLKLSNGPEFVLNVDYDATDVPVPPGVGPVGGNIMLTN